MVCKAEFFYKIKTIRLKADSRRSEIIYTRYHDVLLILTQDLSSTLSPVMATLIDKEYRDKAQIFSPAVLGSGSAPRMRLLYPFEEHSICF